MSTTTATIKSPNLDLLSIGERLRRSYVENADRVAVVDRNRKLTYGELHRRAVAVARGFRSLGVESGDRVVVISPNSVEWVEVDHACYVGGFVRVGPITRLHPRELLGIVSDADASVVVVEQEWLRSAGRSWLPESVQHLVVIGGDDEGTALSLEQLIQKGESEPSEFAEPVSDGDQWLMYTSGSTGKPKGVRCTGLGVGAMIRNVISEMHGLSNEDIALHTAPLSHFSGAIALAVFAAGGCNVVESGFDVEAVARAVAVDKVTVLPMVPTQITMLTEYLAGRVLTGPPVDVSGLRQIPYAGSAIASDRLTKAQQIFGPVLLQFYGASESPLPITALQPEDHLPYAGAGRLPRLASAGRPNRYVQVKIVGPDGAELAAGETGEITSAGPHVMPGYWRLPAATAEVLSVDGWLKTGDVGYFDEHGFLFIVDRKKDMIITGGFNVYPREVETAISSMEGIRECAVVGAPSDKWGEEIVAVVSLKPGYDVSPADVIAHCRSLIAGYKVPKTVDFVDDLPKGGTGKIMKRAIQDGLWEGRTRKV